MLIVTNILSTHNQTMQPVYIDRSIIEQLYAKKCIIIITISLFLKLI